MDSTLPIKEAVHFAVLYQEIESEVWKVGIRYCWREQGNGSAKREARFLLSIWLQVTTRPI